MGSMDAARVARLPGSCKTAQLAKARCNGHSRHGWHRRRNLVGHEHGLVLHGGADGSSMASRSYIP